MAWYGRKRRSPNTPAERLASSRNWRKARAAGRWHQRGFRSVRESRLLRSLVFQHPDWPNRKLARRLGCDHSWVIRLKRRFRANPELQRRREQVHGPASWAEFDDERNKRLSDPHRFALYRQPRIRRKAPPKGADPLATERRVKTLLRSQRMYQRKHGSLDGWEPPSMG